MNPSGNVEVKIDEQDYEDYQDGIEIPHMMLQGTSG